MRISDWSSDVCSSDLLGHLDIASGAIGLIKTALCLHEQVLPPQINFTRPNPRIDFASSPFYVNTELRHWPAAQWPRRAGVSSFGVGGTNAPVIVEEAPASTLSRHEPRSEERRVGKECVSRWRYGWGPG